MALATEVTISVPLISHSKNPHSVQLWGFYLLS